MSVIRETQDRVDPQQNYSLDPTKVQVGNAGGLAETSGTIPEPPPIIQPGADEGNRQQRALESLEGIGEIDSNIIQQPEDLRTYNPPLPDEPLNVPEIGTQFVSNIGDAMGKGVVNPPLYNAQKGGSRFDNLLGVQRQQPPPDNSDIFGPVRQISTDESKPIQVTDPVTGETTLKKVTNVLGKSPMLGPFGGNFVSSFGGIINGTQQLTNQLLRGDLTAEEKVSESFKVMEQLSASWLQQLKVAESLGFNPDAIDRRAWGYKQFEDGTVFNPLGNIPVMQQAFMRDPMGFIRNLAVASIENPLGAIATLGAGSEWGEAGPGAFGMLMYGLTNVTSAPIAAVQDLHTLIKEGNPYATLLNGKFLRSAQGRDYSFTAAQRINSETGEVDNRLSLWAQQQKEPKTWEEWAQRNWLSSGIINSGDFIRKSLTGESGLDDPVSFFGAKPPKNMIGLSEFAVGMFLDGGVDFVSGSAFNKLQDIHASNKAFNSAVKGAPTPFDSLEVLQARQTRNSKRIKQLQNKFVKNGGLNAKDTDELRNLNIVSQENQRLVDRVSDWGSPLEVPTDLSPRGVVRELARADEVIQETENVQRVTSAGGIDAKAPGQDIVPQKPVDGFVVNDDGTINFAYDPKATPKPQGLTLTSVDTGFSSTQADDILSLLPDGTSVAKGPTNFDPATGMFKRNTGAVMEGTPPVGQAADLPPAPATGRLEEAAAAAERARTFEQRKLERINKEFEDFEVLPTDRPDPLSPPIMPPGPAATLPPRPNFETLEESIINNPTASAKIEQAKQHFLRLEADELEEAAAIQPEVLGAEPQVLDITPEEDTIIQAAVSPQGLIRGRVEEKLRLRQQGDLPGVPERAALPEVRQAEQAITTSSAEEAFTLPEGFDDSLFDDLFSNPDPTPEQIDDLQTEVSGIFERKSGPADFPEELLSPEEAATLRPVPGFEDTEAVKLAGDKGQWVYKSTGEFSERGGNVGRNINKINELADKGLTARIDRAVHDAESGFTEILQENLTTQGYENLSKRWQGFSPEEIQAEKETLSPALRKIVEGLEEANLSHGDFFEQNLMYNPKTGDLKFIDTEDLIIKPTAQQKEEGARFLLDAWEGRKPSQFTQGITLPIQPGAVAEEVVVPQKEVITQAVETAKRTTNVAGFVDDAGRIKVEEITQVIEDLSDSQINVMETFNKARADLFNLKTQPIKGDEVIGVPTPASIKNIQDTSRYLAVKEQIFNSYFAQNSKEVSASITRGERFISELQEKIFVTEEALGKLDPASDAAGELLDRLATLEDLAEDIQRNIDFLGAKSQTGQRGRLARLRAAYRKGKIPEPESVTPRAPEVAEVPSPVETIEDTAAQQLQRVNRIVDDPELFDSLSEADQAELRTIREELTGQPVETPVSSELPEPQLGAELGATVEEGGEILELGDDVPTPEPLPPSEEFIPDDLDRTIPEPEPAELVVASPNDIVVQNLEHTQTELESVISNLQEAYVALPPASPQRKLLAAAIDETVGEHKKIQSQINRTKLGDVTSDGFQRNIEFDYDPNDYRSASSPFNEAEDPAQVYVPWTDANGNIHRTPMSEFRQGNLATGEVRPEMMDAYPFENIVGDLSQQADNYVENFYSHLVKKVTQMEAMYTEEASKFQKLLEKIPTTSWKRQPIQKNLPQQSTTTLPGQLADQVTKNKVINNADGLGDGVQPVYHGTRGRDIALTSDPVEVSASGPMGVGTYLTTDPESAANYARSMGVPNRPNVDGTQFNANVGSVFRVTISSDKILDARKAIPKAVKTELKNVLTDTASAQFKTLIGNNGGGEQLTVALGKAIDNANNHKQLIDQIDIAIDTWARQALGTTNLPEEIVLQTQRAVALTYRSFGIDAVQMTKKLKGYADPITEIAVINPQVMRATAVQDMKVPSAVRQAAHRSNAEVVTNKIYGTKRTKDAAVEAKMKLASQRAHETGVKYKKATEQLEEVGAARADRKIQQEIDRVDSIYKKFDADENLFGAANERIRARNASRSVPNQLKTQAGFEDLPYKLNPDGSPKIDFKDFNEFLKTQKDKGIKISDEIEDRMRRLYTEYVTNQAATQTTQQAMAQKEKIIQGIVDTAFSQHITDMVNLNETSVGRWQQMAATMFDYKWKALDPTSLSEAGKIRDALAKASNVANGLIEQYARFQIAPMVNEFMKVGRTHLKPKVGHKLDFRRLMMDVLEIGAFEKLNAQARLMPEARALQKAKYDKLIGELKQFVDEPVVESLLDYSRRISASSDEVRMVANAAGLNLGKVSSIGYVERVLDPDVLRWWRATERKSKAKAFSRFVDDAAKRLDVNVQKSRGSFTFVPEDIDVLATLLKKDRDELMAMMDNNELYAYLRAQDPAVTQALEDFGILSKIHLSNREATEFLLEQFGDNLPELINKELFLTNPQDAFKQYANGLREQVQRSGVFKLLFGQGTKNGWIVPSSVYDALPANAAEAKRIQDIGIPELFGGTSGKLSKDDFIELPASVIEKWAPSYKSEGTVFVHKTVNNQMNSMVNLFGHPESANVVFQAAYSLSRFWNEAMLLGKTGWYTTNIALDSIKQAFAAGTDLMQFPKAMHVVTRMLLRDDLSGLDNTRKVFASFGGNLVTEKQMTLDFLQMWGKNLAPQLLQEAEGGRQVRKLRKLLNPVRGAQWYANFIQSFGAAEAGKSLIQDVRSLQSSVFDKFGRAASHAEMIARYAAYRTWMDRSPAKLQNKVGLTAKKFAHYYTAEEITDPTKAWRHMEDYFTNWDTVGTVPGMVGLLRPFLSYGMWNSPSQVRQFIKNPLGYRNQARMMYYMNQRLFAKEDMNEASLPTWMSDSYYTGHDIEGNPMMLLPHGFDTRFDAITSLKKTEQQFLSDQNILSGSTKEKLEQMQQETDDVTLFRQLLDKSPLTKTLVELSTGETLDNVPVVDPTTGRGPLTGMPWQAEHLLMAYPPIKSIIKTNPGNIFGRPEIRDSETGQVIAPGVPGLIGGHIPVERGSNLDKYLKNPATATNFEKGMRLLARIGGPVRFIDRASNMRMTMRQMNRLLRDTTKQKAELEAKYDKMLKDGRDKTSPKIFKETETKLRRMIWFRMNLQKDMTVMNLYFKANNLSTDKDITAIDKLELENFVRENGSPIYEEFVEKSINDLPLLIELFPDETSLN